MKNNRDEQTSEVAPRLDRAERDSDQHHSGMRVMTSRFDCTERQDGGSRTTRTHPSAWKCDYNDNRVKKKSTLFEILVQGFNISILLYLLDVALNVDVLRGVQLVSTLCSVLLLCSSLCSDMFLSPSPKFPSFRERSEARHCDPAWGWVGWVKGSPPPSLPSFPERWAVPSPSLYFVYT